MRCCFPIIAVLLVVVVLVIVALAARAQAKRASDMETLAVQQGWTPLGTDPGTLGKLLPIYLGVLADVGGGFHAGASFSHSEETYSQAYSAGADQHQVVFFQYDLTEYYDEDDPVTGQRREVSTSSNFVVANAETGNDAPTIFLVHHSLLSKLSSFKAYKGMQQLELEGDFNDYYDTYIMPDTQDEVLEFLTPDTMELLVNMPGGASMQFLGSSMAVSVQGKPLAPDVIMPLLESLRGVIANVRAKRPLAREPEAAGTPEAAEN